MAYKKLIVPATSNPNLLNFMNENVVGQRDAIREVVECYEIYKAGLCIPGRPIANLMFLGPTGTGKTHCVETFTEYFFGNPKFYTRIDCAEYQHSHEIAKLIGSPPGYLGHRETRAALSQENLNQYFTEKIRFSVVLFDEIEKASDALSKLLLGILDKATLTLGDNRRVDFSSQFIFMTSNVGAKELQNLVSPKAVGLYQPASKKGVELEKISIEGLRRAFDPEFINRLDKSVVFRPLEKEEISTIFDLEVKKFQARLRYSIPGVKLRTTKDFKEHILKEADTERYGARPIKTAIQKRLTLPIARAINSKAVLDNADELIASIDENEETVLIKNVAA